VTSERSTTVAPAQPSGAGPTDQSSGEGDHTLDLVMAEIHAEADRLRREDPDLAAYEREVTSVFDKMVPGSASDLDASLSELEGLVPAHMLPPDPAPRPGRSKPKQIIVVVAARVVGHRLVERVMRIATNRITVFNGAVVSFLRGLADRIDRLEDAAGVLSPEVAAELDRLPYVPLSEPATSWIAEQLDDASGPVAHLGCGAGELVRAVARPGRSAYGVDTRRGLHVEGLRAALDLRGADPFDHLRSLPDGSLGGVVLDGFVDRLGLISQIEVADRAARVVDAGGTVAVVVPDRSTTSAVLDDLGAGRPLSPATWAFLLTSRLGTEPTVLDGPDGTTLVIGRRHP
jgi:hypothetical protein